MEERKCNGYTRKGRKCQRILKYKYYCKQHLKYLNKELNNMVSTYREDKDNHNWIYKKNNSFNIIFMIKYFIIIWIINTILKKIIEIIFLCFAFYFINNIITD